jgi:hypothetical protein
VPALPAPIPAVRNPSAVAPTTFATNQRRQPLDLLIVNEANALNEHKRPVRLVRIEKVSDRRNHATLI